MGGLLGYGMIECPILAPIPPLVASRAIAPAGSGRRAANGAVRVCRPRAMPMLRSTREGIMSFGGLVFLLVLVGLVIAIVVAYNKLVGLRQRSEEAWSDIDVQLKRRTDLIPNLIETVKGYAAHERTTLDQVVRARGVVSRPQGEPELPRAAVLAGRGRGNDPELAPLLQRRRPRSQHDDRQLSVQPDRVVLPLRQAGILRARPPRRPSGPARLLRELIASAGRSPRWRSCWRPRPRPWRRREGCSRSTASSPASWSTPTGVSSFGRTSPSSSEGRTRASF